MSDFRCPYCEQIIYARETDIDELTMDNDCVECDHTCGKCGNVMSVEGYVEVVYEAYKKD